MDYTAIVKKLIGNIEPVGETRADEKGFQNLIEMCKLVNELVVEIDYVATHNKDRQEYSMKVIEEYAGRFLSKTLGIVE